MRKDIPSWDETFMEMAEIIAKRSKDPSSQCGTILVSPDKKHIVSGYNGMPSKYPEDEKVWERPNKYNFIVHSETNAIINAQTNLTGWTLYVNAIPCSNCSKHIAQAGIKRVVYKPKQAKMIQDDGTTFFSVCEKMGIETVKYEEKQHEK